MPSTTEGGGSNIQASILRRLSQDKDPTNRVVESYFGFYGTVFHCDFPASKRNIQRCVQNCNERVFSLSYIDVVKVRVEKS